MIVKTEVSSDGGRCLGRLVRGQSDLTALSEAETTNYGGTSRRRLFACSIVVFRKCACVDGNMESPAEKGPEVSSELRLFSWSQVSDDLDIFREMCECTELAYVFPFQDDYDSLVEMVQHYLGQPSLCSSPLAAAASIPDSDSDFKGEDSYAGKRPQMIATASIPEADFGGTDGPADGQSPEEQARPSKSRISPSVERSQQAQIGKAVSIKETLKTGKDTKKPESSASGAEGEPELLRAEVCIMRLNTLPIFFWRNSR
jgi:hypothetical protein